MSQNQQKEKGPEIIGTTEALKIIQKIGKLSITLPTIISWTQKYNIGKKIGGRWWINKQKLIDYLKQEGKKDI